MKKIVIASHNQGKVKEISELLAGLVEEVVSAAEFGISEPEETEPTFAGNAALKAAHSAENSGLPALADDSGLCVDALAGAPGIFSARWAGPEKNFSMAMEKIHAAIIAAGNDAQGAAAHFNCTLALAIPGCEVVTFEGKVHGTLTFPPRGSNGFGYDPIFIPTGYTQTFGEMEPDYKNKISHRANAFRLFVEYMRANA